MRDLRVYGPLKFPHYIRYDATDFTKGYTEEDVMVKQGVYEKKTVEKRVMTSGTMSVISHPEDKIQPGEEVRGTYATYLVQSIIEERPAEGYWQSLVDFAPVFQKLQVQFVSSP